MYAFALLTLLQADPPGTSRLSVLRDAPDFSLINQAEQPVRLQDLRGKVVLEIGRAHV